MPVNISDSKKASEIVVVELVCDGCGDVIKEYEAFADSVDKNMNPIHDKASCVRKAKQ